MLSSRQDEILVSLIQEYTATAVPVSSGVLNKRYLPHLSSATIRSVLAELEQEEYLIKPHTSAGRIPSDKGYRYFVDNLLHFDRLSDLDQQRLQTEMLKLKAQNVRLSRTLARMLSVNSKCLALSGVLEDKEFYDFGMHTLLSDPEFQKLDEVSRISASLDLIDEKVERLLEGLKEDEAKIYIGEENPIDEIKKCSMIVSPYRLESGEKGMLAIIGPKRMEYGKNKSLIDFVKSLLKRSDVWIGFVGMNLVVFVR